jgi:hypothetical protein
MLLAKLALGLGAMAVTAGAYSLRDGILRVDVDENGPGGSHVHFWAPAAFAPMALHFVPSRQFEDINASAAQWLPVARKLFKELKKYPDSSFVEVTDEENIVGIRTEHGKLRVDVTSPKERVHILLPLAMLQDLSDEIASRTPAHDGR